MNRFAVPMDRRQFLATSAALAGAATLPARGAVAQNDAWAGEVGITTSSVFRQTAQGRADRYIAPLDLPKFMRDELGMKVIDLNSGTIGTRDPVQLERFRAAVAKAGCAVSNVKINPVVLQVKVMDLPFDHADRAIRQKAVADFKEWILGASRVGAHWVRPFPADQKPAMPVMVESFTQLADYADGLKMALILENAGWMTSDADGIPSVIEALGGRLGAQPDIGSWESPELREAGLKKAFPYAVSCDFKFGKLGPDGAHKGWDLKHCFELSWQAGFRGPWVLEHADENTKDLVRDLTRVRDMLKAWIREKS